MNSKIIFDYLRKLSGGVLTQAQVIATDKLLSIDLDAVKNMLGIPESMSVSNKGVDLICEFEGKRLVAYDDGVGVWTIGFGTIKYPNGVRVKKGDTCTLEQAKEYMRHDLIEFEHTVNSSVRAPLNQNQFDALVSLAYNIGSNAFKSSTLVKKLNAGDYKGAASQFDVWINAGGKRMQGLVNRRDREKLLFLSFRKAPKGAYFYLIESFSVRMKSTPSISAPSLWANFKAFLFTVTVVFSVL